MASRYSNFTFSDNSFTITRKRTTYIKSEAAKSFPKKASKVDEAEVVDARFYTNFVQSIAFFAGFGRCRATWSYTKAGYLPTTITTISPDGCTKLVDEFMFE